MHEHVYHAGRHVFDLCQGSVNVAWLRKGYECSQCSRKADAPCVDKTCTMGGVTNLILGPELGEAIASSYIEPSCLQG